MHGTDEKNDPSYYLRMLPQINKDELEKIRQKLLDYDLKTVQNLKSTPSI